MTSNNFPLAVKFPIVQPVLLSSHGVLPILDTILIDDINRIYNDPPYGDIIIEKIDANRTGRYLNFVARTSNIGLTKINNSGLDVYSDGEKIKQFELKTLEIGTSTILTVENLRISKNADQIDFILTTNESEISKENNRVTIILSSTGK